MAGRAPIRKVTATGVGGLLTALVVTLVDHLGPGVSEWLAALLPALAAAVAGYATPSAPGEPTAPGRGVPLPRVE